MPDPFSKSKWAFIAGAVLCLAAHAQGAAAAPPELTASSASPAQPELLAMAGTLQVEVVSHYDNAVGSSDSASEGVVRGERIGDLPLQRPGEVLETVPGLVVTQHSGDGKANQYFLRGYNLDHGTDFATFVEGVPVNLPTSAHGQGYTDLNFLIPELVSRIDYQKGPYFAQNGDFSSAGSARVRYVDRLDDPMLIATLGTDGYRRAVLAGSPAVLGANAPGSAASPRLVGAIELEGDNGPWAAPELLRKFNGLLRLGDGAFAQGWSADAMAYRSHWNATDQVPLELIADGTLCRYCALDPTDGGASSRQMVAAEWHRHGDESYTLVSAYAEHYELQLWSDFTFFESDPVHGDQFEQQESRNLFGGSVAQGWQHTLLGQDSTTEVGLQLRHDHVGVGLFDTQARAYLQTVSNDHVGETAVGVYLQNSTAWTPWLRTLVGLRADHVDVHVDALQTPANSGNGTGSKRSPKLSVILGPWSRTEFFLNAGRGFHSNDARGVTGKVDPASGDRVATVPALVGSRGAEVGMRSDWIPGLQTSLSLWRLDSDSELVYSADAGGTEANAASKRYGLEWNNHLVLDRWLLLDADMAWTHARFVGNDPNGGSGNFIPNAVGRVGLLGITAHDLGPWSIGFIARYIGAYPLSQDGKLSNPAAAVSSLKIKRDLGRDWSVSLDVLNLFDRRFNDIAYEQDYRVSPDAPVLPDGITVHPGEPREFRVTLSARL